MATEQPLFNEALSLAVGKCLERSLPFAVVFKPGSCHAEFYADSAVSEVSETLPEEECFVVARWGLDNARHPFAIRAHYTEERLIEDSSSSTGRFIPEAETCPSTSRSSHTKAVRTVVEQLGSAEGKVVVSRVENVDSERSPVEVAEDYFLRFPTCFRAMYLVPGLGLWIVATPEILLDYDNNRGQLRTMSLAGTRADFATPWDEKNLREHQLVTDYIERTLTSFNLPVQTGPLTNLRFGSIEHLCNHITASGHVNPLEVALKLSPTPAVCGWPREAAFGLISEVENHSRLCYGGFIGTLSGESALFYVNLRCCRVCANGTGSFTYSLFAGGGINNMSNPHDEWAETEQKMQALKNLVCHSVAEPCIN
ncbi:MAG: chorismate-binding protein [Firmicutes bacterium]|nr:chorismate-binding protein [Bacillota bacterium]MCM1402009.1 chorismate-binding protein [Bacteroides sp.]MCM1477933.1 chorismate-binding protein [Bacteroides sp.]